MHCIAVHFLARTPVNRYNHFENLYKRMKVPSFSPNSKVIIALLSGVRCIARSENFLFSNRKEAYKSHR